MANIIRRNPFREMMDMRDTMDRFLDRSFWGPRWNWDVEWDLPLDVVETADDYTVKASLPGMNPDDLDISLDNRVLTIKGEIKGEEEDKNAKYHLRERWSGSFTRSVSLPTAVKVDQIDASFERGVLRLRIPKAEEVKPKKIAIRVGSDVIEGKAKNKGK